MLVVDISNEMWEDEEPEKWKPDEVGRQVERRLNMQGWSVKEDKARYKSLVKDLLEEHHKHPNKTKHTKEGTILFTTQDPKKIKASNSGKDLILLFWARSESSAVRLFKESGNPSSLFLGTQSS